MVLLSLSVSKTPKDLKLSKAEMEEFDKKSKAARMFDLAITITALLIAMKSNPDNKLGYGIVALLFPEIYLLQFGVRKYVIKEADYANIP